MQPMKFGSLLAAGALMLGLSACGGTSGPTQAVDGSWQDVVAAANKEGKVVLYSSQNPTNLDALTKAFEAKYPDIDMTYVRSTDAEQDPKVEVEKQTGQGIGDVHMVTDAAWITNAADSGQFSAKLRGPDFDAPDFDKDKDLLGGTFFLTSAAVDAMGWNTDAVPGGFTDPRQMLQKKYTGKIGIPSPVGIAAYVDLYKFYEKNFGSDFTEKLAQLKPRIYPSALGVAQALTSKEIVAAPAVGTLTDEIAAGSPVKSALPKPTWGAPWYTHVLSTAPHPNAAQVLADFMVTPAGQEALNKGYASVLPVKGAVADAADFPLPDPKELTSEKVSAYSQKWESLFRD